MNWIPTNLLDICATEMRWEEQKNVKLGTSVCERPRQFLRIPAEKGDCRATIKHVERLEEFTRIISAVGLFCCGIVLHVFCCAGAAEKRGFCPRLRVSRNKHMFGWTHEWWCSKQLIGNAELQRHHRLPLQTNSKAETLCAWSNRVLSRAVAIPPELAVSFDV